MFYCDSYQARQATGSKHGAAWAHSAPLGGARRRCGPRPPGVAVGSGDMVSVGSAWD